MCVCSVSMCVCVRARALCKCVCLCKHVWHYHVGIHIKCYTLTKAGPFSKNKLVILLFGGWLSYSFSWNIFNNNNKVNILCS